MVIWIDGPYGVGKSTLAERLRELAPHSFVFDAEQVGNSVRENTPKELFNGYIFEGYPLWFELCAALLSDLSRRYDGTIYVPMTLTERDSFEKIAAPLRQSGIAAAHIVLTSTYEVVHDRILQRGEEEDCWCMENIGLCLERQRDFDGVVRLLSVGKTVDELARELLEAVGQGLTGR